MAEVLCPVCGKPNPEDLQECQFCGTRLDPTGKPVEEPTRKTGAEYEKVHLDLDNTIHPGESPTSKDTADLEQVSPSWPKSLRKGQPPAEDEAMQEPSGEENPAPEPEAAPSSEVSDDTLDWLSGLDKAASEQEQVPDWLSGLDKTAPEQEPVPDWMSGLRDAQADEAEPAATEKDEEESLAPELENLDWLARLETGSKAAAPEPPVEQHTPALEGSDLEPSSGPDSGEAIPDWLKLMQAQQSANQESPAAPPGGENVPEWLSGLQGMSMENSPASSDSQEPATAEPDWLSQPDQKSDKIEFEQPSAGSEPVSDWVPADEPSAATPPPSSGEAIPDWLSNPEAIAEPETSTPAETLAPATRDALPDWLSNLGETAKPETSTPAETSAPAGGEARAVWLSNLEEPAEPEASTPAETSALVGGEALPDWLSNLEEPAELETSTPAETPAPAAGESIPDWLPNEAETAEPETGTPAETPAPAAGETLPDWLSNLGETARLETGTPGAFVEEGPWPASNISPNKPDWLTRLQADVSAEREAHDQDDFEAVSDASVSKKETDALPDWLANIEPSVSSPGSTPALITENQDTIPGEPPDEPFSMEMPEWLSKLNPEQAPEEPSESTENQPDTGSLAAAELPAWVQAMRPVESVVESKIALLDEGQVTEQSGPLAGLHGVLPSLPGFGPLRKPPAYSARIHISEGQQRYAASLENLVADEASPRVTQKKNLISNQLWRWVITLVLFLAVGIPLVAGVQVVAPTLLAPSDNFASSAIIDGLTGNSPVLVAFDYDPALSGEMEVVAAPLMDRLLAKGIPLALVSTSPTGPALAEHFLQNAPLINMYAANGGEQTINLGYLPGGPAGLLYFANDPTGAMPFSVTGAAAWQAAPFQGIRNLSDFAAVMVITDNADTGRNWVEQVAPQLGGTPMLMMISAQAEPMLRPYFDAGQIKGFISGLSDAKIYEQSFNRPGQAYHFWDSFKVGMLIAELLIVAGALYGLWTDRRSRAKDSRGAA